MGEKAIDDQQGSSVVITNIKETSGPLNQLHARSHCVCLEGNNVTWQTHKRGFRFMLVVSLWICEWLTLGKKKKKKVDQKAHVAYTTQPLSFEDSQCFYSTPVLIIHTSDDSTTSQEVLFSGRDYLNRLSCAYVTLLNSSSSSSSRAITEWLLASGSAGKFASVCLCVSESKRESERVSTTELTNHRGNQRSIATTEKAAPNIDWGNNNM